MGTGEFAALAAAAFWAVASLLYGQTPLSAAGMNFSKNVLAATLFLVQLAVLSFHHDRPVFSADAMAWAWLGCSGVIGIVLGDTFYFRSLQILGPRRALIVGTTAPIFGLAAGYLFLSEQPSLLALLGIALTVGGVTYVLAEPSSEEEQPGLYPGTTWAGIGYGTLGAICMTLGAVLSKIGMENCAAAEASFIRLLVSALGALVLLLVSRQLRTTLRQVKRPDVLRRFVPAVLCGTWLGIWFSQIAYKHATVGIGITLLSTSPLFVIPLVRIFFGIRVSPRAVVGTLIAMVGVALLTQ
ncbi:MAG: DMT family transporter [Pirellulaceae bacterium]|nr:DMT family transporter [Pirellulaceae bacterium]